MRTAIIFAALALASPALADGPYIATLVCLESHNELQFAVCPTYEACHDTVGRFVCEQFSTIEDTCKGESWEVIVK